MGAVMIIRDLGLQPYLSIWEKMKQFTLNRDETTEDECWMLQHPPVYTQGQAGKPEHVLCSNMIPLVQSDRGGQVTYHGPGQLVVYVLLDLKRRNMGIKRLVSTLEETLIALLADYKINAMSQCQAPGVYVLNKKIASIGLRVKNACTYHGIALNVTMDLSPFLGINPCGYAKLKMTQMSDFVPNINVNEVAERLHNKLLIHFE